MRKQIVEHNTKPLPKDLAKRLEGKILTLEEFVKAVKETKNGKVEKT